MNKLLKGVVTAASILFATRSVIAAGPATQPAAEPLQYTLKNIDGQPTDLAQYKGKVVMIVNVASKCGFTKQYAGLEKLYAKYKDQGFVILGFPANNFNGQEPGSDEDIKAFCTNTYSVTFPIFSKVSVKGADQAPLYKLLTEPASNGAFGGPIAWNFTKFLVGKDGHVYARFASKVTPEDKEIVGAVEDGLKK